MSRIGADSAYTAVTCSADILSETRGVCCTRQSVCASLIIRYKGFTLFKETNNNRTNPLHIKNQKNNVCVPKKL